MSGLQVDAINHLSIEVSDLKRSEDFYHHLLGFKPLGRDLWPDSGRNELLGEWSLQNFIYSRN